MATDATTNSSTPCAAPFLRPVTIGKNRGIPNWRHLDHSIQKELLVLLTAMIGHHVPSSRASDGRGVPDESS
jgi:hypothetical protein